MTDEELADGLLSSQQILATLLVHLRERWKRKEHRLSSSAEAAARSS